MTVRQLPQFTDGIDLRYFIEPLNGGTHPRNYLDRFPDALYVKSPDSHLLRFMYTLLGPVGVGWLQQNLLAARLQLEAAGASLFDLDAFYGDPFSFGRLLTETFDSDISGLLPIGEWAQLRAQDESYRSRAIQFVNAARLGTSPEGMRLAAQSGTDQNCDIVENYRYLFDSHSDDPLQLPWYGKSYSLNEFVVVPRPEVSRTQQQTIDFTQSTIPLGPYNFTLTFNGFSTPIGPPIIPGGPVALNASALPKDIQAALQLLRIIGQGNVIVTGDVSTQITLTFSAQLSNQALPLVACRIVDGLGNTLGTAPTTVVTGALDPIDETVVIADADRHHMQVALDQIRPVNSYPTFAPGRAKLGSQPWTGLLASSEYTEVIRYVTGSAQVNWPAVDGTHWIQAAIENEAPALSDQQQHYVNFHNVATISAYTDLALADPMYSANSSVVANYPSVHIGAFPEMAGVIPYFAQFTNNGLVYVPDRGLADYPNPLTISVQTSDGLAFLNDSYPADYTGLQGVPSIKYRDDHFWSSQNRSSGAEILEIDLGSPQAVNFIAMEVSRKPVMIEVDYDLADQAPARNFQVVALDPLFVNDTNLFFDPSNQSPWEYLEFLFNDGQDMIYTRFIRLVFTRRADTNQQFLLDPSTGFVNPWSIEVRNLRIGRNIAPSVV